MYNQASLQQYAPPSTYAPVQLPVANIDPAAAGIIGAVAGVAVGAAGVAAFNALSKSDEAENDSAPAKKE